MASTRTSSPTQSSVRTPSPTATSVTTPSLASMRTPSPAVPTGQAAASDESGGAQAAASGAEASFWLPVELGKTIPVQDLRWIANTLFQNGKLRPDLELWYEPPDPATIYPQTPSHDRFFTHQLMVWMPHHQWKVRVSCPVCGKQLTGYGVHKRARKVLDVDRYYLMVTETLRCTVCSLNYLSTSQAVRDQLDLPHRTLFRLILTRKYACDIRVIRLLRARTLGDSPARLVKQLKESHRERWPNRLVLYLLECADFVDRASPFPVVCQEPPEPIDIPTSRCLLTLYNRDILSRLDHIKSCITSTFGSILKMDSTKKITKKLAGHGKGTALCVTSLSNEVGQILTSVLSMQEGLGLDAMVSGIMQRYRQAAVPPPVLLYVDSGCCVSGGMSKLQNGFVEWPDLHIRLDIWHFMRRLAVGCTTDAHPLYPNFMGSLSACIFEWDAGDLTLLRQAKRQQLRQEGVPDITDRLVDTRISKAELSQYCRRKTRGEEATITLIERLLLTLGGANGGDLMGVPLLDKVRMEHIWRVQKRHVRCIQDVPGVQLYTEAGTTTTKGGIILTRYRCARGSQSLESFHCHLNRFIPGTSANPLNFQLYFLEGLNRWNQDRGAPAVTYRSLPLPTHAGDLIHCINTNSLKLFGRAFVPNFRPPAKYTGELLGVDYLLSQTGQPLKLHPDSEETEDMLEDVDEGEEEEEEKGGFEEDPTHDLFVSSLLTDPSFSSCPCPSLVPPASSLAAASSQPVTSSLVASTSQSAASTDVIATSQPASSSLVASTSQDTASCLPAASSQDSLPRWHNPLLPAHVRPPSAPPLPGPAHHYHLPGSTVGQAQLKRKDPSSGATQAAVILRPQCQLLPAPVLGPKPTMLASVTLHGPFLVVAPQALSVTLSSAPPAPAPVRKLTRKVQHNTCKKCGQFRTAETGHSQYKGTVYCPSVEALPKEQWLEIMKQDPK